MSMIKADELLEKVWRQWASDSGMEKVYRYAHERRNKRFEDWLWDNGARVTQDNRTKYLRFNSEKQRTWFLMKYG